MANSFGTVAVDVIAQEALTRLIQKLEFVKGIHKNFSTTALAKGQNVVTHILTEMSAQDFDADNGYDNNANDAIQSDVSIPLDQHKHVTFQLTDAERDSSSIDLLSH